MGFVIGLGKLAIVSVGEVYELTVWRLALEMVEKLCFSVGVA